MAATGTPASRKRPAAAANESPPPGVPHLGAGKDEQVAVGGLEVGEQRVRRQAEAAHRRDLRARLGDRDHVEARSGEPPRVQLDEEVTDLGIGEPLIDREVSSYVVMCHSRAPLSAASSGMKWPLCSSPGPMLLSVGSGCPPSSVPPSPARRTLSR
jgi:hypothetical protein